MDINAFIASHEVGIRLGVCFGIFSAAVGMAQWVSAGLPVGKNTP